VPCPDGAPQEEVRYTYIVDAASFSAQHATRCGAKSRKRLAGPRFAPGAVAAVYYNPRQPAESRLDTGDFDFYFDVAAPAFSGSATIGGAWVMIVALRKRRRAGRWLFSFGALR